MRRIHPNALGIALTTSGDGKPTKFDARIGLGSNAAVHIAAVAKSVADAFVDHVFLKLRKPNPYQVGTLKQHEASVEPFEHALHTGYDGLNPVERTFAQALGRSKLPWCRNPSRTGYPIPLIQPGKTENFWLSVPIRGCDLTG